MLNFETGHFERLPQAPFSIRDAILLKLHALNLYFMIKRLLNQKFREMNTLTFCEISILGDPFRYQGRGFDTDVNAHCNFEEIWYGHEIELFKMIYRPEDGKMSVLHQNRTRNPRGLIPPNPTPCYR